MRRMDASTRRNFLQGTIGSLLLLSLARRAARAQTVLGHRQAVSPAWLRRLDEACAAVSTARMRPLQWQAEVESLLRDVPHGHHNMVTMHMMLSGEARARHYERVHDQPGHLLIRESSDVVARPGPVSTVSDEKDNLHWFHALSDRVLMFNIGIYRVDPERPSGDRDYVDPLAGERLAGGLIRARRLERIDAYARYGRA